MLLIESTSFKSIHFPWKINHFLKKMVESEWSIIRFSKYFKIQFAWPTFQNGHELWWRLCQQTENKKMLWEYHRLNRFHRQKDQVKRRLVKRSFFTYIEFVTFHLLLKSSGLKKNPSASFYVINIQSDVIGLVLPKNGKSKQIWYII